jgi:hypothetical protein
MVRCNKYITYEKRYHKAGFSALFEQFESKHYSRPLVKVDSPVLWQRLRTAPFSKDRADGALQHTANMRIRTAQGRKLLT